MPQQPNVQNRVKRQIGQNVLLNKMPKGENQNGPAESKIRTVFTEYCRRSTIHGVGHFIDRNRHWLERVWWSGAIGASMIICMFSIKQVWNQWTFDPIILTPDTKLQTIGNVPFPAVSICPYTIASADKFNFTAIFRLMRKFDGPDTRNITASELRLMSVASKLCEEDIVSEIIKQLPDEYLDDQTLATIEDIAPEFKETFVGCYLFGAEEECDKLFYPIITERGLCYVFNALNLREIVTDQIASDLLNMSSNQPPSNWHLDGGYSDMKSIDSYPRRIWNSGSQASLNVNLRVVENDTDAMCGGGVEGFTIVFHPPNELPQVDKQFLYVSLGKAVIFTIKPEQIKPIDAISTYTPNQRNCFYNRERKLKFFREYTQYNCELECLSNFTLAKCGCVKFSMPRTNGTKICGPAKDECRKKAQDEAYKLSIHSTKCTCLSSCNELWYNAHASQADFELIKTYSKMDYKPNFDIKNAIFSSVRISFKDETFSVIKRADRYGLLEFISSSGALAGLFLGASLLSMVELIYFFALRIFLSHRQDRRINDIRTAFVRFEPQIKPVRQPIREPTKSNPIIVFTYLP